jgi:hypothetical protein
MGHSALLAKVISHNPRFLKSLPALLAVGNYGELLTSERPPAGPEGAETIIARPAWQPFAAFVEFLDIWNNSE